MCLIFLALFFLGWRGEQRRGWIDLLILCYRFVFMGISIEGCCGGRTGIGMATSYKGYQRDLCVL